MAVDEYNMILYYLKMNCSLLEDGRWILIASPTTSDQFPVSLALRHYFGKECFHCMFCGVQYVWFSIL